MERRPSQYEQRILKLNRTISELSDVFDEKFVELTKIFQKREKAIKQRDKLIKDQRLYADLLDNAEETLLTNTEKPANEADSASNNPLLGS
jgi:hypothetical protein